MHKTISDDHAAIEILQHLEATAYNVDEIWSDHTIRLARCIIQVTLRWANTLNFYLKVGLAYVLLFYSL